MKTTVMELLDRIDLDDLTTAGLWSRLDEATRLEAAQSLYDSASSNQAGRREADNAIAGAIRFRPVAVRQLPVERRIGYLLNNIFPDESLAQTLLLALHLQRRVSMLDRFLTDLGIPHGAGLIEEGHDLQPPEAAAVRRAVDRLFEEFPAAQVEVYLACLLAMDPKTWSGLVSAIRARQGA